MYLYISFINYDWLRRIFRLYFNWYWIYRDEKWLEGTNMATCGYLFAITISSQLNSVPSVSSLLGPSLVGESTVPILIYQSDRILNTYLWLFGYPGINNFMSRTWKKGSKDISTLGSKIQLIYSNQFVEALTFSKKKSYPDNFLGISFDCRLRLKRTAFRAWFDPATLAVLPSQWDAVGVGRAFHLSSSFIITIIMMHRRYNNNNHGALTMMSMLLFIVVTKML